MILATISYLLIPEGNSTEHSAHNSQWFYIVEWFAQEITYEMKSPLNSSDQDKICHKLFVSFLDLCHPSNKLTKPRIAKPMTKVFALMSI